MSAPPQSDERVSAESLSFAAAEIKCLYGAAASGSVPWQFTSNPLRYFWQSMKVLANGRFDRDLAFLHVRRIEARDDADGLDALVCLGKLGPESQDKLQVGLDRQVAHAAHLAKAIEGLHDAPWRNERRLMAPPAYRYKADFLLALYGPDPRPAFYAAMASKGIIPMDTPRIGAGALLHTFRTVTDAPEQISGWAILHRCPGAGSFGSFATGAVHRWAANPSDLDRFGTQFAVDAERARSFGDAARKVA